SCDKRDHWLGHMIADKQRGFLFRIAADFPDQHHFIRLRIVLEHLQHIDKYQSPNGISADPDTRTLTDSALRERVNHFIRQLAALGDNANAALCRDITRHDPDFGLPWG